MLARIAMCCVVLGAVVYARPGQQPAFDVASVKPNKSDARGGGAVFRPRRFDASI